MIDVGKLRTALSESGPGDFAAYQSDPVGFADNVLGVPLWSHQRRALEAIATHRRVAWRTAHGIGKTMTAAVAAIWFILTHPDSLVLVTSSSYRQVKHIDWRTIDGVRRSARVPLGGEFLDTPEGGWRFPDGRRMLGFSAGDENKFAGFHARFIMFIVDEPTGVGHNLFAALKGALTGNSRLLLIGNPVTTSGEFYSAFTNPKSTYHQLHTSAYDCPNITGAEPAIPGLIDQVWIDEMIADYGAESAIFASRALGDFPTQAADAVISIALVDAAKEAWLQFMADGGRKFNTLGRLEVGVDVARFGDDDSVIVCRRGNVALQPVTLRGADVTQVARKVAEVVTEHRRADEIAIVRVDTVGVGGGVADVLRKDHHAIMEVVDVNASASAQNATYLRTRDELLFCLRDWLRADGAIPSDPKLEGELTAPTFTYSPAGKLVVEPKDETKKKIKRSPDRMDSLALAVYSPACASVPYDDLGIASPKSRVASLYPRVTDDETDDPEWDRL